jgi:hypothetical protein
VSDDAVFERKIWILSAPWQLEASCGMKIANIYIRESVAGRVAYVNFHGQAGGRETVVKNGVNDLEAIMHYCAGKQLPCAIYCREVDRLWKG